MATSRDEAPSRTEMAERFQTATGICLTGDPILGKLVDGTYLAHPEVLPPTWGEGTATPSATIADAFHMWGWSMRFQKTGIRRRWSKKQVVAASRAISILSRALFALSRSPDPKYDCARFHLASLFPRARTAFKAHRKELERTYGPHSGWYSDKNGYRRFRAALLWAAVALGHIEIENRMEQRPHGRRPDMPFRELLDMLRTVKGRHRRLTKYQVAMLCFAAGVNTDRNLSRKFRPFYSNVLKMYRQMAESKARDRARRDARERRAARWHHQLASGVPIDWER